MISVGHRQIPQQFPSKKFYSQWGQDFIVCEAFKYARNRTFLDIGASSGKEGSNSYYLEKFLGWKGICIEPIPSQYVKLRLARDCLCFQSCAYDEEKIVNFTITEGFDELSGITDSYNPQHLQRIEAERKAHTETTNTSISVMAHRTQWYIDAANFRIIDFLSIDTEGSEFNVIKGIDFSKVHINMIMFEDNYREESLPIVDYLEQQGFALIARIGGDLLMINSVQKNE